MSDAILVPTWLHFPSQNPPKSTKKSIPRCIKFWIDFSTDFSSMLARFWRPTWSHVGHLFLPRAVQNGPQHPPKATKTAKSLKNFENEPQKPMGYPSGPRFWSQHGCIWALYSASLSLSLEARWRGSQLCCAVDIFYSYVIVVSKYFVLILFEKIY